jgi:hypothetical protein
MAQTSKATNQQTSSTSTPPSEHPPKQARRDRSPPAPTIYLSGFHCQPGDRDYDEARKATGSNEPYWFRETTYPGDMYGYEHGDVEIAHDYEDSRRSKRRQALRDATKGRSKLHKMTELELMEMRNREQKDEDAALEASVTELKKQRSVKGKGKKLASRVPVPIKPAGTKKKASAERASAYQRLEAKAAELKRTGGEENDGALQSSSFSSPLSHEPDVPTPAAASSSVVSSIPPTPGLPPVTDVSTAVFPSNISTLTDGSHSH